MSNAEKRQAALDWMRERGIQIKEGQWKGPAVPIENLAGRNPVLQGFDAGLLGQWRNLLRGLM